MIKVHKLKASTQVGHACISCGIRLRVNPQASLSLLIHYSMLTSVEHDGGVCSESAGPAPDFCGLHKDSLP